MANYILIFLITYLQKLHGHAPARNQKLYRLHNLHELHGQIVVLIIFLVYNH